MDSKYGEMNNVSAENQLSSDEYVTICKNNGNIKILFVGNSITKHAPAPEIGWYGNWGMAASCEEKDYVHLVLEALKTKNSVDYCIAQCAVWERNYQESDSILPQYYEKARNFEADIIVIRIGENINDIKEKEKLKSAFQKMILYFNKNKNTKIIITSLFWNQKEINEIMKNISDENDYVFCDISDLEKDEKTMALGCYEHKGICVHPSDYGMKCIADKIIDCII